MKAFMSDIQGPDSQPAREQCGCPNAAMREARRIIGVTESGCHVYEHTFGQAYPVAIGSFGWGLALADALRAFVEE